MWADVPRNELIGTWADGLAPFVAEDIIEALTASRELYKEYPPTLGQFADLCRGASRKRAQNAVKLDAPHTDMPEAVRKILRDFVEKHSQ